MLLLYIMFVEEGQADSGSAVRPNQMLKAFKQLDCDVKVLSGKANDIKLRYKNAGALLKWLKNNKPDVCYIEPPSGPFFCYKDLSIIKTLKRLNVPILLFYRDAYWLFPKYFNDHLSVVGSIKAAIIKHLQKRDIKIFEKCCYHIFFPSDEMAKYFNFKSTSALPSGCITYPGDTESFSKKRLIYVGGATKGYGVFLLLDSVKQLNDHGKKVSLTYICPQEAWDQLPDYYKAFRAYNWLNVKHINGEKELQKEYDNASIAVIPRLKNEYLDFSMPVKLFEYISHLKPVIATNCTAMANFITANHIGIIVEDKVESLASGIWGLVNNQVLYESLKINCRNVREKNTWKIRAKEVLSYIP